MSYRTRILEQLGPDVTAGERSTVREQLSGACTTEIAAFDEFVGLLDGDMAGFLSAASKICARLSLRAACLPPPSIAVSSSRSAWLNSTR